MGDDLATAGELSQEHLRYDRATTG